jgi:hypothetical protein
LQANGQREEESFESKVSKLHTYQLEGKVA